MKSSEATWVAEDPMNTSGNTKIYSLLEYIMMIKQISILLLIKKKVFKIQQVMMKVATE